MERKDRDMIEITLENICRFCRMAGKSKEPCLEPCKEWNKLFDKLINEKLSGGNEECKDYK